MGRMSRKTQVKSFTHGLEANYSTQIDWSCFHQHQDEIELAFHPRGEVTYRFGGRLEHVHPDETIMYWGSIPHQAIEISKNDICYYLTIPVSFFVQIPLPEGFITRILSGDICRGVDPVMREADLLLFDFWKATDTENISHLRHAFMHWVQFRFIRFAHDVTNGEDGSPGGCRQESAPKCNKLAYAKVKRENATEQMFRFITENYLDPITVEDVAETASLNPNYANTIFREETGISIGRFITMLRVYRAQSLLLTTDLKVIDIALESGFRSLGNFYKMFSSHVGRSPSEYRSINMPSLT